MNWMKFIYHFDGMSVCVCAVCERKPKLLYEVEKKKISVENGCQCHTNKNIKWKHRNGIGFVLQLLSVYQSSFVLSYPSFGLISNFVVHIRPNSIHYNVKLFLNKWTESIQIETDEFCNFECIASVQCVSDSRLLTNKYS